MGMSDNVERRRECETVGRTDVGRVGSEVAGRGRFLVLAGGGAVRGGLCRLDQRRRLNGVGKKYSLQRIVEHLNKI